MFKRTVFIWKTSDGQYFFNYSEPGTAVTVSRRELGRWRGDAGQAAMAAAYKAAGGPEILTQEELEADVDEFEEGLAAGEGAADQTSRSVWKNPRRADDP